MLFLPLGIRPLDPREECSDEATEEALRAQVNEQTSPLFYDAMNKRPAKPVLKKADTH